MQHWIILPVHIWVQRTISSVVEQAALAAQLDETRGKPLARKCQPLIANCTHHQNPDLPVSGFTCPCALSCLCSEDVTTEPYGLQASSALPSLLPFVSVPHFRPCSLTGPTLSVSLHRDTCFIQDNCYFSFNVIAIVTFSWGFCWCMWVICKCMCNCLSEMTAQPSTKRLSGV